MVFTKVCYNSDCPNNIYGKCLSLKKYRDCNKKILIIGNPDFIDENGRPVDIKTTDLHTEFKNYHQERLEELKKVIPILSIDELKELLEVLLNEILVRITNMWKKK